MNRRRVCLLPLGFLLLLGRLEPAAAEPSCPDAAVPVAALIMPPPKHDSAQTKAELQELLRLQETRTARQVEHVRGDDHRTVGRFLGGMGIKIEQLSNSTVHFFDCIAAAVEKTLRDAKTTFMRTRPYRLHENKLHTLKKLSDRDSTSYPSGMPPMAPSLDWCLLKCFRRKRKRYTSAFKITATAAWFRAPIFAAMFMQETSPVPRLPHLS